MSQLIAYLCSDHSLNRLAMAQLASDFDFPPTDETSGFGLGWIQDNRSLLRTNPRPTDGGPSFGDLISDIPTRSLVGYLRDADGAPPSTADMQPFRFRKWVFAHDGEVPGLDEFCEELLDDVPGFIRGNIKGTTGAEILFHLFLAHLHEEGVLDRERERPSGCADAMAAMMREAETTAALSEMYCIGVTQRTVVVGRSGNQPVYYKLVEGIKEHREKPLFAGHRPKPVEHPSFRAFAVATEISDEAEGWEEVPDRHVLWMSRDWEHELREI